jgi:hypothetical protein
MARGTGRPNSFAYVNAAPFERTSRSEQLGPERAAAPITDRRSAMCTVIRLMFLTARRPVRCCLALQAGR